MKETQNKWVEAAARVARRLHQGQKDKAEVDYFEGHLSVVASLGRTWQERVVGYLHDASEDTPHSVEQVLELVEDEAHAAMAPNDRAEVAQALQLLNHHTASDRQTYIRRIGEHALARAVKLNDLTHNMDIRRLPSPTEKDYQRLERYRQEYAYLTQIASEEGH